MNPVTTIVTACDRNYVWGAYLLAASAARFVPGVPFHLCHTGFEEDDLALFRQFPSVRLVPLSDANRRNVCNRKAEALLSADTDYVAWLDADCMIIGDIAALLIPENEEFQIRLREPWENAWIWRHHYTAGEPRGPLPRSVLEQWRADVAQRDTPALDTTCVTNAIVLHRRHLGFVREWQAQIAKVLPATDTGVVDANGKPAYFMTDESVFSSLLVFSRSAPPVSPLRLNRDPAAHVAHFGANPKPWKQWRLGVWYCNTHALDLLDWAREKGHRTPPIPWSLRRSSRPFAYLIALGTEARARLRALGGRILKRKGKH
jgi:hypothetical protein